MASAPGTGLPTTGGAPTRPPTQAPSSSPTQGPSAAPTPTPSSAPTVAVLKATCGASVPAPSTGGGGHQAHLYWEAANEGLYAGDDGKPLFCVSTAGAAIEDAKDRKMVPADPKDALTPEERDKLLVELKGLQTQLTTFQGESPLIFPSVDQQAIASVVSDWTGIPVGRMVKNEIEQVLRLADILERLDAMVGR